jgi:hypothetical protein
MIVFATLADRTRALYAQTCADSAQARLPIPARRLSDPAVRERPVAQL